MNWEGRTIVHAQYGRGRVLTDLADDSHTIGRMRVLFLNSISLKFWVDARNCTFYRHDTKGI